MSTVQTINDAYTQAVKSKNTERRDTLKLVKAAFLTLEKSGKTPSEVDYLNVLQKMSKNMKETAKLYPMMASTLLLEAAIVDEFIPKQLTELQVSSLINEVVLSLQLPLIKKNMGIIVKAVISASNGQTDGKIVSGLVNKLII
jgi:uncharacterized protein YqeY